MLIEAAYSAVPMLGPEWIKPDYLIAQFGPYALWGIALIVFVETGLLFPLLPGDSLLFTAGLLVAQDSIETPLWLLCTVLFAAAFLGDQVGYFIGSKFGVKLFQNPDAKILKPKHIEQANEFFHKYGGRTLIIARFVPFLRTYAPVAAGIGGYHYPTFLLFNGIGALGWGVGVTVLGYHLGSITFVKENIELMLVGVIFVSLLPIFFEWWRARRGQQTAS